MSYFAARVGAEYGARSSARILAAAAQRRLGGPGPFRTIPVAQWRTRRGSHRSAPDRFARDDEFWSQVPRTRVGLIIGSGLLTAAAMGLVVLGLTFDSLIVAAVGILLAAFFIVAILQEWIRRTRRGAQAHLTFDDSTGSTVLAMLPLASRPLIIALFAIVPAVGILAIVASLPVDGEPWTAAKVLTLAGLLPVVILILFWMLSRTPPGRLRLTPEELVVAGPAQAPYGLPSAARPVPWSQIRAVGATETWIEIDTGDEVVLGGLVAGPIDLVALVVLVLTFAADPQRRALLGTPDGPAVVAATLEDLGAAGAAIDLLTR